MLRVMGAFGLALGLMTFAGTAQSANNPLVVWQGGATLTSVGASCPTAFQVGDLAYSSFRPQLNGDEPPPAVTMIFGRGALLFLQDTGGSVQMQGTGTYTGGWISGRATGNGKTKGNFTFTVTPDPIDIATDLITIVGKVTKFADTVGCNVQFKAAYRPRGN